MSFWIMGIVITFSHFVEGVSGFGCMILALPVISSIVGIKTAVPLLVILSTFFDLVLVWKDRRFIQIKQALKIIMITSITMPLGFLALRYFPEQLLSILLGCFMVLIAVHGLLGNFGKIQESKKTFRKGTVLFLPLAGLVQGAFGGSGPFIIVYVKEVIKDKTTFRGTLALVWVVLNVVNLIQYQVAGILTIDRSLAWSLSRGATTWILIRNCFLMS